MAGPSPLIGRTEPLGAVVEGLRRGDPVLVVGEAGIGKTSLVRAAATRAGRRLHEGGGLATLSWLPYLALRRAVQVDETIGPARVAADVRATIGAGTLFVDDLQWADEATRSVVDRLLGALSIVVAVREGEPDAAATIHRVRVRGATVVRLRGLPNPAALALVGRIMPGASGPARRQVVDRSGGNPLLIEELAAHGGAPSWLVRALLRQVECLGTAERRALKVAAIAGRPLPLTELGPVGTVLAERGLLEERPGGVVVRHRLVVDALGGADPPRRADPMRAVVGRSSPDDPSAGLTHDPRARTRDLQVAELESALTEGRLFAAAAAAAQLLAEPLTPTVFRRVLASRGLALALQGLTEDAERTLAEAAAMTIAEDAVDAVVLAARAEASLWSGLPSRALEQARRAVRAAIGDAERAMASLTLAWAEVELGRSPSPVPPVAPNGTVAGGSTGAAAGALAELRGLNDLGGGALAAAANWFEVAAREWAGRNVPRQLVCQWAAGEAQRRAESPDAVASLRAVLEAAVAIGFEPLAARVRRSLRLAGDRPAPQRRARPAGDPLTAREREVLGLVERGRTNAEIARRMGLGRPTVARILSNAMLKLGAESRVHAVILAAKHVTAPLPGERPDF